MISFKLENVDLDVCKEYSGPVDRSVNVPGLPFEFFIIVTAYVEIRALWWISYRRTFKYVVRVH